jgi:hypothetical protein
MVEYRTSQPVPPGFPQVHISGVGMVSLATLDELRDARDTEQANADHLTWQTTELYGLAEDRFANAGALLVPRRAWWQVPSELSDRLALAERLVARTLRLDERIASLEKAPQSGRLQLASKIRRQVCRWAASVRRFRSAARLREALVTIGRTGAAAGMAVPEVEPLIEQAIELQARAEGLRAALSAVSSRLSALDEEINLRRKVVREMSFDSLYLAAHFNRNGLPVIQSPIRLEIGEVAHFATDASLARLRTATEHAGRGPASGPLVDHTGIRQWIGVMRNRSALLPSITLVDRGILVVSSRRLAFVGAAQSVGVSLDALVDADIYADALALSWLGQEEPAVFLVTAPRKVAFYLNWAMSSAMVGTTGFESVGDDDPLDRYAR